MGLYTNFVNVTLQQINCLQRYTAMSSAGITALTLLRATTPALLIHFVMARLFKIQFTRSTTSPPEYLGIMAETREQARDIFYGMNPTYFVTAVF